MISRFASQAKTLLGALPICMMFSACEVDEDAEHASGQPLAEGQPRDSCVVAETSAFQITGKDVARVRGAMFPPPGWDEAVRLTQAAALAFTLPQGQPSEDSDTRGVSADPWLAAYERLTRAVKLEGGGDPSEMARRIDKILVNRFRELDGKIGACGGALDRKR